MTRATALISICCVLGIRLVLGKESPIVRIKNGTLEGTFMTSRKGREFMAFRGIPYAQPPVGELRFEPPKPFDSWTGVRSAKEDSNMCTQRDMFGGYAKIIGDEDCLYLNVYAPKLSLKESNGSKTNYPVMIWIHGGGWIGGANNFTMYGPKFILDHDVIVVAANYRLGALGFFSTEDLVAPGNQGLKDQLQAIKWVKENIAAFNGDSNRVTIFGESAGGASVHYHMISPLSRGLFHRAISQSGVVLNPWAMNVPGVARDQATKIGELLDCPTVESSKLVDCLKKKNIVDIAGTVCPPQVFEKCPTFSFRPVIEPDHPGAFINEAPDQSLKSGKIGDVPWLAGVNSHEGALSAAPIYGLKDQDYVKQLDENFMELAPQSMLYEDTCPENFINNLTRSIRKFYLGDKKIDESTRWSVIDMYTDSVFYIGIDNAVRDHLSALSSPVFYYYLAYRGSSSLSVAFGDAERDYGVAHGDDLQYLFPIGELIAPNTSMSEEDLKMVDVMTSLWVNFAESGNPTPEKILEIPVKWKPVRTSNLEYLHIRNSKDLRMADNLLRERVDFWAGLPDSVKIELNKGSYRSIILRLYRVGQVIYGSKDQQHVKIFDEKFIKLGSKCILLDQTCTEKFVHNVTKSIRKFYMGDKKIDESTRWNITDTNSAVRDHLAMLSSPVYYYHFAYRGSYSFSIQYGDPERDYGVVHGDKLQYLFPVGEVLFPNVRLSEEDLKMTELMTGLWVKFAKSGNPTPEKTPEICIKWKPVSTLNLEYLHIGNSTDLRMADKMFQDRVDFWASIPHRDKIILNKDTHRSKDEL